MNGQYSSRAVSGGLKLAIMQPYFLPYIGYFQLMNAVDRFVVLDDVNFINRGWVNRNRLLMNGAAHTFTLPLRDASQNRRICDMELMDAPDWRSKLMKTVRQAYAKAPYASEVSTWMAALLEFPSSNLAEFLLNSLREVASYLSLNTEILPTSRVYENSGLKGQERILDICAREGAGTYLNLAGGMELYERAAFRGCNMELEFVRPGPVIYTQGKSEFVPNLSILDVLMFNGPVVAKSLLAEMETL